jgi:hypothetical protein
MNNGLFNTPDKIDRECKEIIKNTLAQKSDPNKKLQLQQIITTLSNIRLHSKQEIVGKKIDITKLEEEINFYENIEEAIRSHIDY